MFTTSKNFHQGKGVVSLGLALWSFVAALANAANHPQFTSIDFPGAVETAAAAINDEDDICGRYTSADGRLHGFVLRRGMFTSIDFPGAPNFTDVGWMNDRGDIAGLFIEGFVSGAVKG